MKMEGPLLTDGAPEIGGVAKCMIGQTAMRQGWLNEDGGETPVATPSTAGKFARFDLLFIGRALFGFTRLVLR